MDARQGSRMPADTASSTPLATAAAQLGAALGLHIVLSLLLLLTVPGIHAALGIDPLAAVAPGEVLVGWAALTLGPAAAWSLLVLARAAAQRRSSAFWFAISAGLVAAASFGSVLATGNVSRTGTGPALVAAAWLLVPCAIAVAALTVLMTARGAGRSLADPPGSP
jgi:hypothetical protein